MMLIAHQLSIFAYTKRPVNKPTTMTWCVQFICNLPATVKLRADLEEELSPSDHFQVPSGLARRRAGAVSKTNKEQRTFNLFIFHGFNL